MEGSIEAPGMKPEHSRTLTAGTNAVLTETDADKQNTNNPPQMGMSIPEQTDFLKCEECDFTTELKKVMVEHFKETHSLICKICGHISAKMYDYKRHQLSHMTEKKIQCQLCDYKCKLKTQLDYHMIRIHENKKSFVCDQCGKRFNTKGSMSRHLKRTHLKTLPPRNASNTPTKCEVCGHMLASRDVYKRHMLLQHSGMTKQYRCSMCKYEAKEFGSLRDHTIGSHGKKLKCLYCSFSAPRHSRVASHTSEKHPDKPPFVCSDCGFFGNDIHVIGEHVRASHPDSVPDSAVVKYLDMLEELRKTHDRRLYEVRRNMGKEKANAMQEEEEPEQADLEEQYRVKVESDQVESADMCNSSLVKVKLEVDDSDNEESCLVIKGLPEEKVQDVKELVEKSKRDKQPLMDLDFQCDSCSFVGISNQELSEHQLESHSAHQCKECGHIANTKSKLKAHVQRRHEVQVCDVCGHSTSKSKMKSHKKIHFTSNAEPLKCKYCSDFSAKDKAEMENHVNQMHKTDERFICHICGTAKKDGTSLKLHMLIHSDEKPFKCQYCDYAGKQKRFLDIHVVRVHENRKNFICDQCGKGYNDKLGLTRHLKGVHLKSAPPRNFQETQCEICNKFLVSRDSYKRHVLLQHSNIKKLKCNMCKYEAKEVGTLKDHVIGSHGKRLQCLYCSFSAPRHSRIFSHCRSKHPGMKAFKCEVCDFVCDDIHSVHQHMTSNHQLEQSDIGRYLSLLDSVMKQYDGRLWEKRRNMGQKQSDYV